MTAVEKIVSVVVTSTKNEKVYSQILNDKNFHATTYIRGLQGAKGDAGDPADVPEATKTDIDQMFE